MKINRHGKAKILTQEEIQYLFNDGFQANRDRSFAPIQFLEETPSDRPFPIKRSPLASRREEKHYEDTTQRYLYNFDI